MAGRAGILERRCGPAIIIYKDQMRLNKMYSESIYFIALQNALGFASKALCPAV